MIIRRLFSKGDEIDEAKLGSGLVGGVVGAHILKNSNKNGELSGRVKLYHGTSEKAKKAILKEGLRGDKALDPNNLTNKTLNNLGQRDGRNLIYTTKKKSSAKKIAKINKSKGNGASILEISIPYDEYNNKFKKSRIYENPEFSSRGIKTKEEFVDQILNDVRSGKIKSKYSTNKLKRKMEKYWDDFSGAKGTSGTRIFEGNIESKYIKGGKGYEKNSLGKIIKYAKNNPKRFAKGAGKAIIGTGLIAGGVALNIPKRKKEN